MSFLITFYYSNLFLLYKRKRRTLFISQTRRMQQKCVHAPEDAPKDAPEDAPKKEDQEVHTRKEEGKGDKKGPR